MAKFIEMAFYMVKILYNKEKYGFILSLIIFIPIIIRISFKLFFHNITGDNDQLNKYKFRFKGLINSILGRKSYLRLENMKY